MKKIILTGGGTAGHVTPHLALLPELHRRGFEPYYIGSHSGIEKELIAQTGIEYHAISGGKLRRYFDLKNISDSLRVVKGLGDALKVIGKIKPNIVFSKGGFVTVPVVAAAWLKGVPVIIHESDYSPGLANKLSLPFAKAVCCNFPETQKKLRKAQLTGTPIRAELLCGDREKGLNLCGFENTKPVIMFMGGSLGARAINQAAATALPRLLKKYQVIHLAGRGNVSALPKKIGYAAFEYAGEELPHLFAVADLVVSRAGANSIFELLALRKPNLLIPLSRAASRGDQILNAQSFERQSFSVVLPEENLTPDSLCDAIEKLYAAREAYIKKMQSYKNADSTQEILKLLERYSK